MNTMELTPEELKIKETIKAREGSTPQEAWDAIQAHRMAQSSKQKIITSGNYTDEELALRDKMQESGRTEEEGREALYLVREIQNTKNINTIIKKMKVLDEKFPELKEPGFFEKIGERAKKAGETYEGIEDKTFGDKILKYGAIAASPIAQAGESVAEGVVDVAKGVVGTEIPFTDISVGDIAKTGGKIAALPIKGANLGIEKLTSVDVLGSTGEGLKDAASLAGDAYGKIKEAMPEDMKKRLSLAGGIIGPGVDVATMGIGKKLATKGGKKVIAELAESGATAAERKAAKEILKAAKTMNKSIGNAKIGKKSIEENIVKQMHRATPELADGYEKILDILQEGAGKQIKQRVADSVQGEELINQMKHLSKIVDTEKIAKDNALRAVKDDVVDFKTLKSNFIKSLQSDKIDILPDAKSITNSNLIGSKLAGSDEIVKGVNDMLEWFDHFKGKATVDTLDTKRAALFEALSGTETKGVKTNIYDKFIKRTRSQLADPINAKAPAYMKHNETMAENLANLNKATKKMGISYDDLKFKKVSELKNRAGEALRGLLTGKAETDDVFLKGIEQQAIKYGYKKPASLQKLTSFSKSMQEKVGKIKPSRFKPDAENLDFVDIAEKSQTIPAMISKVGRKVIPGREGSIKQGVKQLKAVKKGLGEARDILNASKLAPKNVGEIKLPTKLRSLGRGIKTTAKAYPATAKAGANMLKTLAKGAKKDPKAAALFAAYGALSKNRSK